jgi:hypothetical protein
MTKEADLTALIDRREYLKKQIKETESWWRWESLCGKLRDTEDEIKEIEDE